MSTNLINPSQDPNYQLFKYSGQVSTKLAPEVRIGIEDLVRTGFQDKYNELAQSVIYNIYSKFSSGTSGQQSLVFETSKGEFEIAIVGAGVVQGVGIITADSVVYNVQAGTQTITNVKQALDLLLYEPPTIDGILGGWNGSYFEVGVNPITSDASVTGHRTIEDIANVTLTFTNTITNLSQNIAVPSPSNQISVTSTLLATSMAPNVTITAPGSYALNASVVDVHIPPNNNVNVTSSKSMQLLYPIIFGSSSYDTFSNSLSNVQTQFNATFMPSSGYALPGSYLTTGISLPLYRDVIPKPVSLNVIHGNNAFTYFLFPQSYYPADPSNTPLSSIQKLLNTFRIQDGSTNLNYPYDTDLSLNSTGGFQDVSTEWRVRPITISMPGYWSNVPYYLVTSKVLKPKLTLKYTF